MLMTWSVWQRSPASSSFVVIVASMDCLEWLWQICRCNFGAWFEKCGLLGEGPAGLLASPGNGHIFGTSLLVAGFVVWSVTF